VKAEGLGGMAKGQLRIIVEVDDISGTAPLLSARRLPNGLEMSRPASQGYYRAKAKLSAGRVGSIELLGGQITRHCALGHGLADDIHTHVGVTEE